MVQGLQKHHIHENAVASYPILILYLMVLSAQSFFSYSITKLSLHTVVSEFVL